MWAQILEMLVYNPKSGIVDGRIPDFGIHKGAHWKVAYRHMMVQ